MEAIVKYLRSDQGIQNNCKILDVSCDKVYEFLDLDNETKTYIVKKGKKASPVKIENGVVLIPFAVNNDYKVNETVYCFDSVEDTNGNIHKGFFGTLMKINNENKNIFGIEPLVDIVFENSTDKLYWSNEIVNVLGSIHPDIDWLIKGNNIDVSREKCNINTKLRISTDLKVKCPTCKNYHPNN